MIAVPATRTPAQPTSIRSAESVTFASLRRVRSPRGARRLARVLLLVLFLTPAGMIFIPWQQTVEGKGRVVAYHPSERTQTVEAPVEGRVMRWHVAEGDFVQAGAPIADIEDQDPLLPQRLARELEAILGRRQAAERQAEEEGRRIGYLVEFQAMSVRAAEARLQATREQIRAAEAAHKKAGVDKDFAKLDYDIHREAATKGLEPERIAQLNRARYEAAIEEERRVWAAVLAAREAEAAAQSEVEAVRNNAASQIASARVAQQSAEQQKLQAERDAQQIERNIARQRTQNVTAPATGYVLRLEANAAGGGQLVKPGDVLATIVPETQQPVVELYVNGRDAPLIDIGRHVRLQFEGWPAVQFTGWPSVAIGTFGGRVILVDATSNAKGEFRILVEPDPSQDGQPWPEGKYLRQGNRANGWVFLNRVTLGYELWRRLNGFPPVLADKQPETPDKPFKKKVK